MPGCTTTSHGPAELLPRWQKVHQSRATQPRGTDAPDWVTTSVMQPTFWDTDSSIICKCHGRPQLAPNGCNLGGGRVGLGRCCATQPRCPRKELMESVSLMISGRAFQRVGVVYQPTTHSTQGSHMQKASGPRR